MKELTNFTNHVENVSIHQNQNVICQFCKSDLTSMRKREQDSHYCNKFANIHNPKGYSHAPRESDVWKGLKDIKPLEIYLVAKNLNISIPGQLQLDLLIFQQK